MALIAGMIASEVGGNVELAKRAALLHDIGKGVEADGDGSHIEVGVDLARRLGEDPKVLNAIGFAPRRRGARERGSGDRA